MDKPPQVVSSQAQEPRTQEEFKLALGKIQTEIDRLQILRNATEYSTETDVNKKLAEIELLNIKVKTLSDRLAKLKSDYQIFVAQNTTPTPKPLPNPPHKGGGQPNASLDLAALALLYPNLPQTLLPLLAQYVKEKEDLIISGLLEKDGTYTSNLSGQPIKYIIPTQNEIASRLEKNKDLFEMKVSQGFTRLSITPNGLPITNYLDKIKAEILAQATADTSLDPTGQKKYITDTQGNKIKVDITNPNYTWPDHLSGTWTTYDPVSQTQISEADYTLQTKGYDLNLLEADSAGKLIELPRAGNGKTVAGRKQIESGEKPQKYLDLIKAAQVDINHPHHGEGGLNRQADLTLILTTLIDKSQMLSNYDNGSSCVNHALASKSTDGQSAVVAVSFWDGHDGQFYCNGRNVDYDYPDGCPRVSVRV